MGANMKHYTEDGLYDGPKHKMDDGSLHTGDTHTEGSEPISHKPFKMAGYPTHYGTSPMTFKGANAKNSSCYDGYHKEGTKKSPTGAGNGPVNNCVKD